MSANLTDPTHHSKRSVLRAVPCMFALCAALSISAMATAQTPNCPADVDGDGRVDIFDLLTVLANWGACKDPQDCSADVTGDGVVDIFDLLSVLGSWGPCGIIGSGCSGYCGGPQPDGCWCDEECAQFHDCLNDVCAVCDLGFCDELAPDTCKWRCGHAAPSGCWCDESCCSFQDCCADKAPSCGGCDPLGENPSPPGC